MEKFYARIFFCTVPALIATFIGYVIHPAVGAIFGACVFGLGWQVTEDRR